jgi:hypothetical protein
MFLNALTGPFLGSLAAGLGGRWLGARGSGVLTVLGLGTSMVCSFAIFLEVLVGGCPVVVDMGSWFGGSTLHVSWLFSFDSLTACMMVTVTTVSFCVHLYSLGYMQADPHLPRFMSYLSLFTGGMLILVTASDFITLLVGWELIGVCSYLLIGFWFHRLSATKAAQKAVLVNRVSDTALMVGMMASWWYLGSTDLAVLVATSTSAAYTDFLCAMLLAGALGKSAQIGLHVWLADAMEGLAYHSVFILNGFNGCWGFKGLNTKSKQGFSDFQRQCIVGMLLSDGHLRNPNALRRNTGNYGLEFTFKAPVVDFVKWLKFDVLGSLCTPTLPTPYPKEYPSQYWFATRCFKELTEMEPLWYEQKESFQRTKKLPSLDFFESYFTEVSLAHWFMGDGYWLTRDQTILLCTECFTLSEVTFLKTFLWDRFNLKTSLQRRTNE